MKDKNVLIAEFEMTMIGNFFKQLDRQGPGSIEETKRALSFIRDLPVEAKIADLGCGTGGQTITLAQQTTGKITAVDLFPGMIEGLMQRVKTLGLEDRISGIIGSMDDLQFAENEFDLIWAEGSIYHIGFEKGLNEWNKYLKKGGYIAVTEATWLQNDKPDEIEQYWNDNYPEINLTSFKLHQMEMAGYTPIATFVLPESCWTDNYYKPMAKHVDAFLEQQEQSESARLFINRQKQEIAYYERYKTYFGYVFYIGRKI